MTRIVAVLAAASAFALAAAAPAQLKAGTLSLSESEGVVKVVSVDRQGRTLTIQTSNGNALTVKVPPEAQNLDQVRPGAFFRMRYIESLAVAINAEGTTSDTSLRTVEMAPKGGNPGGRVVNTRQITSTVVAVDYSSRNLVVEVPGNTVLALRVADNVQSLESVKVGNTISLTYTEALAMEMIPHVMSQD